MINASKSQYKRSTALFLATVFMFLASAYVSVGCNTDEEGSPSPESIVDSNASIAVEEVRGNSLIMGFRL